MRCVQRSGLNRTSVRFPKATSEPRARQSPALADRGRPRTVQYRRSSSLRWLSTSVVETREQRLLWGGRDVMSNGCNGSAAPVHTLTERSVARLTPRRQSPMTAAPLFAAARTGEVSRAEGQLASSQREFARRRRSAATAAQLPLAARSWPAALGRFRVLPSAEGLADRQRRAVTALAPHRFG
jgi:hypothetical protein